MEEAKNPEAFREFELTGWESSVDRYADRFSPLTRQTIPAILDSLGDVRGKRILDVACGPGDLAKALAAAGAEVVAVDFAPAMIDRAKSLNPGFKIDFRVDDAEELTTLATATFDAVVMNYGILHLGRPTAAIRAAARVLKPGGRFVFSCWQEPSKAQGFAAILDAVKEVGATPADVPHGPNFFTFSDDTNIRTALETAGFADVRITDVDQTWEIPDGQALFDAFLEGTARTGGMLRKLSAEDRAAVRELAVRLASGRFSDGRGSLSIPMPTKVASGDLGL